MKNIQKKALILSLLVSASVITTPVVMAAPAWVNNSYNFTKDKVTKFGNGTANLAKKGYSKTANGLNSGYGSVKNACSKGATFAGQNKGKVALGTGIVLALLGVGAYVWSKLKPQFNKA